MTELKEDLLTELLSSTWDDAEYQAAVELDLSSKRALGGLSADEAQQLNDRAVTIYDQMVPGTMEAYYQHKRNRIADSKHDEVIGALQDVKESVDRSAVAANAIDFAKRHPFLAGFFGRLLA